MTDRNGYFTIGWTASGSETLRASKEGFQTSERPPTSATWLRFDLLAIDTPVVIAGIYDLTLTAANECTQLPNVARQRTHRAQVNPHGNPGSFNGDVLDGDFPYVGYFSAEVRREPPRTLRVNLVGDYNSEGLVERIGREMFFRTNTTPSQPTNP